MTKKTHSVNKWLEEICSEILDLISYKYTAEELPGRSEGREGFDTLLEGVDKDAVQILKKALGIEICMKCGGMEILNEGIMTQIICLCAGKVDTAVIKYNEHYGDVIDKELY